MYWKHIERLITVYFDNDVLSPGLSLLFWFWFWFWLLFVSACCSFTSLL